MTKKFTEEQKAEARKRLQERVSEMLKDVEFDALERLNKLLDDESSGLLDTELNSDGQYEAPKNFLVALGHHLIWAYGKPYAKNDRKWLNAIKKLKVRI